MIVLDDVAFPLLVIAKSKRRSGIALLRRPLLLDIARCSKKSVSRPGLRVAPPRAVFLTHATRWQAIPQPAEIAQVACPVTAIPVTAACEFLECGATVQDATQRVIDAYPQLERRLAPVLEARGRSDTVRNAQPLVAAMIVAHAVSVAHLMKHG